MVKPRQLWKLLSGVALLVFGLLVGTSAPTAASTGGCAGDIVVALNVPVWSRPGHDTYGFTLSPALPGGEWQVQVHSSDAYSGRSASLQLEEQWVLDITDHVVLGPTSDLADGVEATSSTDFLGTFVSADGVSHFTVRHAAASTPRGTNSVTADCVSFTRVVPTPTTTSTTTTTAPPTTSTVAPTTTTTTDPPTTSSTTTTTLPKTNNPPPTTPPKTVRPPTTPPPTSRPPTTLPPTTTLPEDAEIEATAIVDCASDEVLVLLGNGGGSGATVDIALPLSGVRSGLTVDPGEITTSTLVIGDLDGITEIRVSDSETGEIYVRTDITVDCDNPARPSATTILDCAAEVLVVRLGNDAGDPAQLTVLHERVSVVAELTVAAGETVEVEIPLAGAAQLPVRVVDAAGNDVLRVDITNVCPAGRGGPTSGSEETDGQSNGDGEPGNGSNPDPTTSTSDCSQPVDNGPLPGDCAEVEVVVSPDCPSDTASVSIRRDGMGRERFVVLVGGQVAGVVAIDGTGEGTVPVSFGSTSGELTVSRSSAARPITVGTITCDGGSGPEAPLAVSVVVLAVLASAAGALPWPMKFRPI